MESVPAFPVGPQIPTFAVDPNTVFSVIFLAIFVCWLVFTLVVIYHWLRHASESWIAVPAVALHLAVSGFLIFYATSGLH